MTFKAKLKILAACLLSLAAASEAQILWNMENLHEVKTLFLDDIRDSCVKRAEEALQTGAVSIVDKNPKAMKFAPEPRYYVSLGRYYWPNGDKSKPYVQRDGESNPEIDYYDRGKLSRLTKNLKWLSIAFYLTETPKYYDAFVAQLKVWFVDQKTLMLPNLEYAQVFPGHGDNRGTQYGIIDGYDFIEVLEAIRLADDMKPIDKETMKVVKAWFTEYARWLGTSPNGLKESRGKNNHAIAYDLQLLAISLFIDDKATAKRITDNFSEMRLEAQIKRDGRQPQELSRTSAFHYSVYNLDHIVDFCVIQESLGEHYYLKHREKINSAFAYLWQFVGHKEDFPYKELKDWDSMETYLRTRTARLRRLYGADVSFVPSGEKLDERLQFKNLLR